LLGSSHMDIRELITFQSNCSSKSRSEAWEKRFTSN
jgi:hypothetical protein